MKQKVKIPVDFEKDRFGHNHSSNFLPSWGRIVHLAHARGYVMARRPHCPPFVISEKEWGAFPYWDGQEEFDGHYLTDRWERKNESG